MGGEHSGVTEATTDILIECAYFDPAAHRPDRPEAGPRPPTRAAASSAASIPPSSTPGLAARHRDGDRARRRRAVARSSAPARRRSPSKHRRLSRRRARRRWPGSPCPPTEQQDILQRLGFGVDARGETWRVAVPSWRRDVDGAADLVEEVVRIHGLDKVAVDAAAARAGRRQADRDAGAEDRAPRAPRRGGARAQRGGDLELHRRARGRRRSAARPGARQPDQRGDEGDAAVARSPACSPRRARNLERGAESVRLFEVGRRYLADGERPTLGLVLAGPRGPRALARRQRRAASTPSTPRPRRSPSSPPPARRSTICRCSATRRPSIIPASSGRLCLGPKNALAEFRRAPPRGRSGPSISTARSSPPKSSSTRSRRSAARPAIARSLYAPPPLQAVRRDFAFLVPADTARRRPAPRRARRRQGGDRRASRLFDLFTGAGVPEGEKSLAVEVTLQPAEKSFTEEELKAISGRIVARRGRSWARRCGPDGGRGGGPRRLRPAGGLLHRARRARSPPCSARCSASGSTAKHRIGRRVLDWAGNPDPFGDALRAAALRRPAFPRPQRRRAGLGRALPASAAARSPTPFGRRCSRCLGRRRGSAPGSTGRRRPTRSAARRC